MSRYDDRDRGYDRGYDRDRGYGRDREREYKVYVGNLPSGASRQEVEDAFGRYGTLKNVWVARNPPGFAFVFFEDERDASDAVDGLNETKLCGAEIRVEHSTGARRGGKFRGGGRNDRCYECGEYGHFARNCYNRRSGGGRSSYRGRGRSRSRSRSYSPRRRSRSRSYSPRRRYSRSKSRSRSNSRGRSEDRKE